MSDQLRKITGCQNVSNRKVWYFLQDSIQRQSTYPSVASGGSLLHSLGICQRENKPIVLQKQFKYWLNFGNKLHHYPLFTNKSHIEHERHTRKVLSLIHEAFFKPTLENA